ncbi:MAG: FAD-dependent oxidoreductase [Microbacterium sp.]
MVDTPHEASEPAIARVRRIRVAVIGGGIAGLVAALEWARIGASVTVFEAQDRLGGAIETRELDDLPVDVVADTLPLRDATVVALLAELGLSDAVEAAAAHSAWVAGLPGAVGAAPSFPADTTLGIPANPWADDVRRVIGWSGAWRAFVDRLRPPLTIGHERSLGRLVRARMGDRVVDRLVAPVTWGLYSVHPDDIDVDAAAPGLSAALTRVGSLSGAVTAQAGGSGPDAVRAPPCPQRSTLRGGLRPARRRAGAGLAEGTDATAVTSADVSALTRRDGVWHLDVEPGALTGTDRGDVPGTGVPRRAGRCSASADVVVLATGASAAASSSRRRASPSRRPPRRPPAMS